MLSWDEYESRFRAAVRAADHRRRFNAAYVERCLAYAAPLHERGVPVIYDAKHLSRLVGYEVSYLYGVANAPQHFYRTFSISKASGGTRPITEPLPSLKEIQRWILENVLEPLPNHRFAKGFIKGRSIRDNARYHRHQPSVLRLDLEDFFGSIGFPRILRVFVKAGYSRPVAILLARLCVLANKLPQGAPTSPALSNQVAMRIDRRLAAYAKRHGIRYTRYADDLTFSGSFSAGDLIPFVRRVAAESGLRLNEGKTRLMKQNDRQTTTGIVVNDKLQAPRSLRRDLRKALYFIEKYGANSHIERAEIHRANYLRHMMGIATFIIFVNPKDEFAAQAREKLRALIEEGDA